MRSAMITGASSGIGRAMALEFARRGGRPIITARRTERLEALRDEILGETGVTAEVVTADLLEPRERDRLVERFTSGDELPDLLVNNAGFGMNRRFLDSDGARMESLVRLDLEVPVRLSRAFATAMVARGRGSILNVASIAGFVPTPFHAVYSATKAAFLSFSEAMHLECRDSGVLITALCPGVTDTEFFEAGRYVTKSAIYRMKRMTPEVVAAAGLDAVERGRMTHVPGLKNRLLLVATRLFPRRFVTRSAGKAMNTD